MLRRVDWTCISSWLDTCAINRRNARQGLVWAAPQTSYADHVRLVLLAIESNGQRARGAKLFEYWRCCCCWLFNLILSRLTAYSVWCCGFEIQSVKHFRNEKPTAVRSQNERFLTQIFTLSSLQPSPEQRAPLSRTEFQIHTLSLTPFCMLIISVNKSVKERGKSQMRWKEDVFRKWDTVDVCVVMLYVSDDKITVHKQVKKFSSNWKPPTVYTVDMWQADNLNFFLSL